MHYVIHIIYFHHFFNYNRSEPTVYHKIVIYIVIILYFWMSVGVKDMYITSLLAIKKKKEWRGNELE
jgi:hypothetical protein